MLTTLGIKKTTPFIVIHTALKSVAKKSAAYPWNDQFRKTMTKVKKAALTERAGEAVDTEVKKEIFGELKNYVFKSSVFTLESGTYDFNELKERFAESRATKEHYFDGLANSVEALQKLQESTLPKINKKAGYGFKKHAGILVFTPEFRKAEIARKLPNPYLVYPSWVVEDIPAVVIDTRMLDSVKTSEILDGLVIKHCENPMMIKEAQKTGPYQYYVFLPKSDLRVSKIIVLGKKYVRSENAEAKLAKKREELKLIGKKLFDDIAAATRAKDFIINKIKKTEQQITEFERSVNSPTVKMSEIVIAISELERTLTKLKASKKDAEIDIANLQKQKEDLIEQARTVK